MDGNGRWALAQDKKRTEGHKKGGEAAKQVITQCAKLGVKYLTLFAFSAENWNRPTQEVGFLMDLLLLYIKREVTTLTKNNIKFSVIGDLSKLDDKTKKAVNDLQNKTSNNTGLHLQVAISYGARQEIVNAAQKIAASEQGFTTDNFAKHLYTNNVPDPDLLIRTGGELRISNFLLWQLAYTELYFTKTLWPDFTADDLNKAIDEFKSRERRYGNV